MLFQNAMKRFYDENGYLVVPDVFSDAELRVVRERTEAIARDPSSAPGGVLVSREGDTLADKSRLEPAADSVRAIAFMVRFDPEFQEAARNPRLLEMVRGLIGPRVKVFRDQMLLKPPGGQEKPLHQDQSYFRVQPEGSLITAWIALDPATVENGCMEYVPGSHLHGVFPVGTDPDRPVHHVPLTGDLQLAAGVLCPVAAGSVIFHHGCTLHRSGVNRTGDWRRALILHYSTAAALSENPALNAQISLEID